MEISILTLSERTTFNQRKLHKILVDLRSKRASTETETAEKSFQVVGGFALTSLKDNWLESINRIDYGWTDCLQQLCIVVV